MNEHIRQQYQQNRAMLRIGCVVKAKRTIVFCGAPPHYKGQEYVVTEDNISYYVVNLHDYDIVNKRVGVRKSDRASG